jgi:hypothetical protein
VTDQEEDAVSESPESTAGAPHPAANQPGHADGSSSGAPRPDEGKHPTPGADGAVEDRGRQGGTAGPQGDVLPTPGDPAGVTVNSEASQLGSSEASRPVQSTSEMVTDEAQRRSAQAPDPDSAAPGDSALPPA